MLMIELSQEESEALALVLQERCRELRFEIAHTDHREYKHSLMHRLEIMEGVLRRVTQNTLGAPLVEAA